MCKTFERLPWELDPSIEPGDIHEVYAILEMISYDDAWKQFIEEPDKLSEEQAELISQIRYRKRDMWGETNDELGTDGQPS